MNHRPVVPHCQGYCDMRNCPHCGYDTLRETDNAVCGPDGYHCTHCWYREEGRGPPDEQHRSLRARYQAPAWSDEMLARYEKRKEDSW